MVLHRPVELAAVTGEVTYGFELARHHDYSQGRRSARATSHKFIESALNKRTFACVFIRFMHLSDKKRL
jgi:hypothetical protein